MRGGSEVIVQEANKPAVTLSLTKSHGIEKSKRYGPGLFTGKITMRDDFDDALPMEFWFGEDISF